jgi:hypothetical protein
MDMDMPTCGVMWRPWWGLPGNEGHGTTPATFWCRHWSARLYGSRLLRTPNCQSRFTHHGEAPWPSTETMVQLEDDAAALAEALVSRHVNRCAFRFAD